MSNYLLGIDCGCTVSKAAIFTVDGREIAVSGSKVEVISPQPGYIERDANGVWRAAAQAVRQVLAQAGIDPGAIVCVACTGHGNGLYLVDRFGRPVRHAILSTDSRARAIVDRWLAEGLDKLVRPKTMQALWPAQPNALLAWLQAHEPQSLARARWVLMCKDFVRMRLTGQAAGELTDWSGTSLLDVARGEYDDGLLEAFGIQQCRSLLPPLCRSEQICGTVTAEAAAATGLREGTPVAGGLFDIDACALASGVVDENQLCMAAGTWGCNQYASRQPVVSDQVFMTSRYCIPGYYLILEGSATSASNLEWFVNEFFAPGHHGDEAEGQSIYQQCSQWVAQSDRHKDSGIVFLPFLYGSHAQADAKGCLLGLSGWHTRGDVLRAVYEGVVFAHRTHVDRLLRFRPPPASIRLTGGAARSSAWLEIFADCFQLPIEVPEGTELGALGAAICAAVAAGCYASFQDATASMVRIAKRQLPDQSLAGLYEAKYARYRALIELLGSAWPHFAPLAAATQS